MGIATIHTAPPGAYRELFPDETRCGKLGSREFFMHPEGQKWQNGNSPDERCRNL